MVSDDTEHTCMIAQALLAAPEDAGAFVRCLGWKLRWWLLGIPAGIGLGTLRAILKLWLGFPPEHSGVFSAGNGPAMRVAILGVCIDQDDEKLRSYVQVSTRLTHTDSRAEQGALIIALAARHATQAQTLDPTQVLNDLQQHVTDPELLAGLAQAQECLQQNESAQTLAMRMGLSSGVTGYICHTVPIALFCWLKNRDDFRGGVEEVVRLGGDTDTTAAITGALLGATVGESGIPRDWLDGLIEWPRSVSWMKSLSQRLSARFPIESDPTMIAPLHLFWPAVLARNVVFAVIVLAHIFRRFLPPY